MACLLGFGPEDGAAAGHAVPQALGSNKCPSDRRLNPSQHWELVIAWARDRKKLADPRIGPFAARAWLIDPGIRRANDLTPAPTFLGDELGRLHHRASERSHAHLFELFPHAGLLQHFADGLV